MEKDKKIESIEKDIRQTIYKMFQDNLYKDMGPNAVMVYIAVMGHYGASGGESIPSMSYLKDRTKLTYDQIRQAHKRLEDLGLVSRENYL